MNSMEQQSSLAPPAPSSSSSSAPPLERKTSAVVDVRPTLHIQRLERLELENEKLKETVRTLTQRLERLQWQHQEEMRKVKEVEALKRLDLEAEIMNLQAALFSKRQHHIGSDEMQMMMMNRKKKMKRVVPTSPFGGRKAGSALYIRKTSRTGVGVGDCDEEEGDLEADDDAWLRKTYTVDETSGRGSAGEMGEEETGAEHSVDEEEGDNMVVPNVAESATEVVIGSGSADDKFSDVTKDSSHNEEKEEEAKEDAGVGVGGNEGEGGGMRMVTERRKSEQQRSEKKGKRRSRAHRVSQEMPTTTRPAALTSGIDEGRGNEEKTSTSPCNDTFERNSSIDVQHRMIDAGEGESQRDSVSNFIVQQSGTEIQRHQSTTLDGTEKKSSPASGMILAGPNIRPSVLNVRRARLLEICLDPELLYHSFDNCGWNNVDNVDVDEETNGDDSDATDPKKDRKAARLPKRAVSAKVDKRDKASDEASSSLSLDQRTQIIEELVLTEQRYCACLEQVLIMYIKPLRVKKVVSQEEMDILFSNVEEILNLSQRFLKRLVGRTYVPGTYRSSADILKRRNLKTDDLVIGDILKETFPSLKIYSKYIQNSPRATELLRRLDNENEAFSSFLEHARLIAPKGKDQSLASLLIQPVQRVPRYKLLIQQLLKHTPENHATHGQLKEALQLIESLASFIDQPNLASFSDVKMIELQNAVGGDLLSPHRKWLYEGTLVAMHLEWSRNLRLYLLSDMLCYAFNPFELVGKINLVDVWIRDLPYSADNLFQVLTPGGTMLLSATSEEEKFVWLKMIASAVDAHLKNSPDAIELRWTGLKLALPSGASAEDLSPVLGKGKAWTAGNLLTQKKNETTFVNPCFGCSESDLLGPIDGTAPALKEGYLTLKTAGKAGWHRRWWILEEERMLCFVDKPTRKSTETLKNEMSFSLHNCLVARCINRQVKKRNCFFLYALGLRHMLGASSPEELEQWIAAIKAQIRLLTPQVMGSGELSCEAMTASISTMSSHATHE